MASRFWVGGTGPWNSTSTANWSATSGGASGASAPTSGDVVTFDTLSGTGTCTADATAVANNVTFNSATVAIVLTGNIVFQDLITFTQGSIDLGGFSISAGRINSNNSNARSIAFGTTGAVNLNTSGTNVINFDTSTNFTLSGSRTLNATYSGSVGTRNFNFGSSAGAVEANVFDINITAGTDIVTIASSTGIRNFNFTGFAGSWTNGASTTVFGNLTISAGMTVTATTGTMIFAATSGTKTITTNGKTLDFPITINGVGGTFQLADAFTQGSTRAFTLTNGAVDFNGKTTVLGTFSSSSSNTRTIAFGSGAAITIKGSGTAFTTATSTNLTITGTATVTLDSGSAKTFAGGGKTWPITLKQGGAGNLTVTGANTFTDIQSTLSATIILPASTTTTVTALTLSGTAGNVVTLQSSSAGTAATLSQASGSVNASYLSIKDSTATGGAIFRAPLNQGNANVSGNTGWNFAPAGSAGSRGAMALGLGLGL